MWLIFNNGLGKLGFAFLFQHGQPSLDSCFRFSALECVKTVLLILVKAQVCFRKDSNVCVSVGSPVLLYNRHQRPWDENVLWGRQAEGVFCLCLVGLGLPGIEINKVPAALSVVLSLTSDSWPSLLPFLHPFLASLLFLMFWNKVLSNLGCSLASCNTRDDLQLLSALFPLPSARITDMYLVPNLTFPLAIKLRWNSHTNDVSFFSFLFLISVLTCLYCWWQIISVHFKSFTSSDCSSYGHYTFRVANP